MDLQDIGVALSVLGAVGWIFKIWIIAPLNATVQGLKDMIIEARGTIEDYRQLTNQMAQDIAVAIASVKSAHKRLDELQERIHTIEMRCSECCRKDD